MLRIEAYGLQGVDIEAHSSHKSEAEVFFARGSRFIVTSYSERYESGKKLVEIAMKETTAAFKTNSTLKLSA